MSGMPSVQPTSQHPATPVHTPRGQGGAASADVHASATSMSASSISMSMTVTNQVSAMLGQIDPSLANHDLLKLALTLLILQTLSGNGKQGQGSDALAGLLGVGGGNAGSSLLASSTTTMAFEATSVQMTSASVDAYASAGKPGHGNGHLNLSA